MYVCWYILWKHFWCCSKTNHLPLSWLNTFNFSQGPPKLQLCNVLSFLSKHEQNFASIKISAKFWWRNFAVKNFTKWKIMFCSMLSYDLWAEFCTLQNFAKNLTVKFCQNEFRNTKTRASLVLVLKLGFWSYLYHFTLSVLSNTCPLLSHLKSDPWNESGYELRFCGLLFLCLCVANAAVLWGQSLLIKFVKYFQGVFRMVALYLPRKLYKQENMIKNSIIVKEGMSYYYIDGHKKVYQHISDNKEEDRDRIALTEKLKAQVKKLAPKTPNPATFWDIFFRDPSFVRRDVGDSDGVALRGLWRHAQSEHFLLNGLNFFGKFLFCSQASSFSGLDAETKCLEAINKTWTI